MRTYNEIQIIARNFQKIHSIGEIRDLNTPAFIRRLLAIPPQGAEESPYSGKTLTADDKIIDFLSVIAPSSMIPAS